MSFFEELDSGLTTRELALVRTAAAFCVDVLEPQLARARSRGEPCDRAVVEQWAATGMLGLQVPEERGGFGASFLCKIRIAQEMAGHSFAGAFCLNNMQGMATRLWRHGSSVQKERLLQPLIEGRLIGAPAMSEPAAGSDLSQLRSHATRTEGGWLLNGTKAWVSNGTLVNLLMVLAQTNAADGSNAIAGFLVQPTAGGQFSAAPHELPGAAEFKLAEIGFKDHFVPDWALIYAPGEAFRSSMAAINAARVHVAAMCTGSLHAALATAIGYCGRRVAFGKPLLVHQGLQWALADVAAHLEAANALVMKAARKIDDGACNPELAASAKKIAVEAATDGIETCIRAMGAVGATAPVGLVALASEVRLAAFADGSTEMLNDRIGRSLAATYSPKRSAAGAGTNLP
jgi:alkylation response protein AidB-like acyl-CoA dehydrogenase